MALILTLAAKDWSLFWSDRRTALLCFLVPIVLASGFGMIFDRAEGESPRLPLAVVCESNDPAVTELAETLCRSPRLDARLTDRAAAERLVGDRQPGVAVVFPANFQLPAGLMAERPKLLFLHHPAAAAECQWAEGVLTEMIAKRVARQAFGNLGEAAAAPPFIAETRTVAAAAFNSYSHSFSGMTLQYLLFWGMESGLLLLRERRRGAWRRIRCAPVPLHAILLGNMLATGAIAFLQIAATFAFGWMVFDVTISGSLAAFVLLAVVLSLLAAATGLAVASLGGTEARARSLCILAILGLSLLGGLWLPAFLLPQWVRDIAAAFPTSWAMQGLNGVVAQGRGFADSLPSIGMVVLFSAAFLTLAAVRFAAAESRRRLTGSLA